MILNYSLLVISSRSRHFLSDGPSFYVAGLSSGCRGLRANVRWCHGLGQPLAIAIEPTTTLHIKNLDPLSLTTLLQIHLARDSVDLPMEAVWDHFPSFPSP